MKRDAQKNLDMWLQSKRRKPLIIWGARQVGKTYLVLELFAKERFKNSYIYIDFKKEDEVRSFCTKTANASKIIEYISLRFNKTINEDTLLIFDEIQECPNIISSLKYFCQDFAEIPVIATGSMVRIKLQRQMHKRGRTSQDTDSCESKFLFPVGKINQLTLFPMTFAEFLKNSNEILFETIYKAYQEKCALDSAVHEIALAELYKYLLVGGMPEAVQAYIDGESLVQVRQILTELYDNYLADMELYQASHESIVRSQALFQNIYNQLNRESKNFSPSMIEKNKRTRDFVQSIQWLCMAHVVNQSYQLKEHITCPLLPSEESCLRFYLADVGMFSYQSGINASSFVSSEEQNTLSGIFFENFVANELVAKGIDLFYWKGKSSCELEFIVEANNKLYPIDVKKGKGMLNSLSKFAAHNKFEFAIKLSKNNYGFDQEKKLLTAPLYFASFIASDLAKDRQ